MVHFGILTLIFLLYTVQCQIFHFSFRLLIRHLFLWIWKYFCKFLTVVHTWSERLVSVNNVNCLLNFTITDFFIICKYRSTIWLEWVVDVIRIWFFILFSILWCLAVAVCLSFWDKPPFILNLPPRQYTSSLTSLIQGKVFQVNKNFACEWFF